jgi:hypothetical protein
MLAVRKPKLKPPRDARTLRLPGTNQEPQGIDVKRSLRFEAQFRKRELLNLLRVNNAVACLERLPTTGAAIHGVMRGDFAFSDLIPAMLRLLEPAATLRYLAATTLGFSRIASVSLIRLMDAGQIAKVDFVCASYFQSMEPAACQYLRESLTGRGSRFAAARCHAKVYLFEATDGRRYVCEASANIRACQSIEQFAIIADADLFEFHRAWINEIMDAYVPPKENDGDRKDQSATG